ncbi:T9SS type A sorting domain-containing protein [Reichenbachiella sp. MSK19-1]|uniref:T9SS type A sorting domain-containing protein n=1 Tax=Reichenbachiella sp. MSK19-1 TaxID=1897631 RepID=UPI000E6BD613|nr:T9SS type A sorting domain-containing protein [Reichenbachiella sp. MSK19-1]
MKRVVLLVSVLCIMSGLYETLAQTSVADGNWAVGATWTGGTSPGYTVGSNITINSYVISDETVTLTGNNKTLSVNDTLIIHGDLIFTANSGAAINIGPNNVLIIMGNLDLGKNNAGANIEAGGVLVVKGNITASGVNGEFTGDGNVYTDGTTDGVTNNGSQPVAIIEDMSDDSYDSIQKYVENDGRDPLPVDLLYFDVVWETQSYSARLKWVTSSETNNSHFVVERSDDGVLFGEIAQIDGQGTINTTHEYEYVDQSPRGDVSYYRLKQVDFDGAYEYFDVKRITTGDAFSKANVVLYPSTVTRGVVQLKSGSGLDIHSMKVYSISGVAHGEPRYEQASAKNVRVDLSDLRSGSYILLVTSADATAYSLRFVVR